MIQKTTGGKYIPFFHPTVAGGFPSPALCPKSENAKNKYSSSRTGARPEYREAETSVKFQKAEEG